MHIVQNVRIMAKGDSVKGNECREYFLPEGYVSHTTCVRDGFWTPERISREPFNGSYNVFKWISEKENMLAGKSILDVGCGPASKFGLFFPHARITGIDTHEAIALARMNNPKGSFLPCDLDDRKSLEELCGMLATFDVITCIDVIEHVLHPENILRLIRKCMAPDSVAYIGTLERDRSRGAGCLASPKAEHVREWNQAEFTAFIENSGFIVDEVKITAQALRPTVNEKALRVQTLRCH